MNRWLPSETFRKYQTATRCLAILLVFASLLAVVYISGFKNHGDLLHNYDARFWYVGGTMILNGVSPFDHQEFENYWIEQFGEAPLYGGAFVYPPTISLICLPMALLPWDIACWALRITSLLALMSACYLSVRLVWPNRPLTRMGIETYFLVAACGLLGSVTQTMLQGQLVLFVMWGLVAMFYGWRWNKTPLLIAGFVAAMLKPQIGLLPILFVFFAGGHRKIFTAILVALAVSVVATLLTPLENLPQIVQASIREHIVVEHNRPIGYDSLPALIGATAFGRTAIYCGILIGCFIAAWFGRQFYRSGLSRVSVHLVRRWQIILALVPAWMPLHQYDFVIYVPLVATLAALPGWWRKGTLLALIILHQRLYKVGPLINPLTDDPVTFMLHLSSLFSGLLCILLVVFYVCDKKTGSTI
jgi:Glycosyltransferase family 87